MDNDYSRDLAIKIMDFVWYDYLKMVDDSQEYDFHLQDTIHSIINEHLGIDNAKAGLENYKKDE
jgi:hypothetical protein